MLSSLCGNHDCREHAKFYFIYNPILQYIIPDMPSPKWMISAEEIRFFLKMIPDDEFSSMFRQYFGDIKIKAQELLEKVKEQAKAGTLNELDPLVLKSSDLTVARGQNKQFSDVFTLSVFAIEDSVNSGIIADNYGKKSLAILKKTMTENEEEMKKYVLFIRSQLAQFKLQKLQSVVTKAARELTEVEYNESAINSVIKESSSNLDN